MTDRVKSFAFAAACFLILGVPPVQAQLTFITNSGAITITGCATVFDGVDIPGSTNGYPVTVIGAGAFANNYFMPGVIIPDSVTNIEAGAFFGCSSLTGVSGGSGVVTIGDQAFGNCFSLHNITLGNRLTSIGDGAFQNCENYLTSLTIPDSVTNIGDNAFYSCVVLQSVTLGSGVARIGTNVFFQCAYLTNISVSAGNLQFASINGALFNKSISTLISFPEGLHGSYTIPSGVTNIGNDAFDYCRVTNVTIPDSVISIGTNAFFQGSLTAVIFGKNVQNIGDYAFLDCTALRSVNLPAGLSAIGVHPFENCYSLTNISVASANAQYTGTNGMLFDKSLRTLLICPEGFAGSYIIPGSVTSVGDDAFYDCLNLTNVVIGNSVSNIGNSAFYNCNRLRNPTLGNGIIRIGDDAFYHCSLANVIIPNSVTSIGDWAFYLCPVTNLVLGSTVQSIGASAFEGSLITSVIIPDSVGTIGDSAFAGSILTNVSIGTHVTNIGSSAFYECNLTSVTIPDSVINLGDSAFSACELLTNITFGKGVASVGNNLFFICYGLTSITVDAANPSYASVGGVLFNKTITALIIYPEGLSGPYAIPDSVTTIGENAFLDCAVTSVTAGRGITNIGSYAFAECDLRQIYFQGNAPLVNGEPGIADSTVFAYITGTVYYLPGTTGWGATFGGWPTALWNPQMQTSDGSFGPGSNGFGFNLTGTADIPVVVEACTNLGGVWTPLFDGAITNGSIYFGDADWTNYPKRFYRVRSP